jgi:hypothetical protein
MNECVSFSTWSDCKFVVFIQKHGSLLHWLTVHIEKAEEKTYRNLVLCCEECGLLEKENLSYICPDCSVTADSEDNEDDGDEEDDARNRVDVSDEDSEEDDKIKELLGLGNKGSYFIRQDVTVIFHLCSGICFF